MSIETVLVFVVTCTLLAVTPGPNMALIIANTLRGGLRDGLATLAGTATGLAILVTIVAVGMTSIMLLMAEWFDVIRWIGALYLIYLGIRQLRQYYRGGEANVSVSTASARSQYLQGFAVALSNPKALLFLGAFLPQFITSGVAPSLQIAVLGVLFVMVLSMVDLIYTLALARARNTFDMARFRILDGVAGGLLVAGGLFLATARRP
jgi:threonine/homoserine/homoserine lactone efflux protein